MANTICGGAAAPLCLLTGNDLQAINAGTFKAEPLPEIDPAVSEFFPAFFDGFTLPDIAEWAAALPALRALPELEGVAVVIAQSLSDAAAAEHARIEAFWQEVTQ